MTDSYIKALINYAVKNNLIEESDRYYCTNAVLSMLKMDAYDDSCEAAEGEINEILDKLCDVAAEKEILYSNASEELRVLYVAMTRAKKLLIIVGSRKALEMAVANYRSEVRYTLLQKRLPHSARQLCLSLIQALTKTVKHLLGATEDTRLRDLIEHPSLLHDQLLHGRLQSRTNRCKTAQDLSHIGNGKLGCRRGGRGA